MRQQGYPLKLCDEAQQTQNQRRMAKAKLNNHKHNNNKIPLKLLILIEKHECLNRSEVVPQCNTKPIS